MNDDIATLYAFNKWANDKMLDSCRKLTADQFVAEPLPGWTPVRTTVWHIAIVTEGWLKALSGNPDQSFPKETEIQTADNAATILDRAYRILEALLPTLTPDLLATPKTLTRRGRLV